MYKQYVLNTTSQSVFYIPKYDEIFISIVSYPYNFMGADKYEGDTRYIYLGEL